MEQTDLIAYMDWICNWNKDVKPNDPKDLTTSGPKSTPPTHGSGPYGSNPSESKSRVVPTVSSGQIGQGIKGVINKSDTNEYMRVSGLFVF